MTCINLSANEAQAAVRGELTYLIRPVKPEPFAEHHWTLNKGHKIRVSEVFQNERGAWVRFFLSIPENPNSEESPYYKAPFAPGDVVILRETWQWANGDDPFMAFYKVDNANLKSLRKEFYADTFRWLSPSVMPIECARFRAHVEAVECKAVREITEEEALGNGIVPFPLNLEGDCWTDGKATTALEYWWRFTRYPGLSHAFIARCRVEAQD